MEMARFKGGHPGKAKPASHRGSYLGTVDPPHGWLTLNEGRELTCNKEGYWLDPGHKRKGHHLVVMGGELMEITRVSPSDLPTGQEATVPE